jgi:hypothetical protein
VGKYSKAADVWRTTPLGGVLGQAAWARVWRLVLAMRGLVPRVRRLWLRRRDVVMSWPDLVPRVKEERSVAGDRAKKQVAQPVGAAAGRLR